MPLPTGVVQVAPRKFSFTGGHVLHQVDSLAQIVALRGAAIFFSDGNWVMIGGRDLDIALLGLTGDSLIGALAVRENQNLSFAQNNFIKDNKLNERWFLSSQRAGAVRTVSHVFGLELGPLVAGFRSQSNTVAASDFGAQPRRIGTTTGVGSTAGAAGAYALGAWYGSGNTNVGTMAGAMAVISVPLGVTWDYLLRQFGDKFENSNRTEVQDKILESIALVTPKISAFTPIPCLHLPLQYSNGAWRLILPGAMGAQGGGGVATALYTSADANSGIPMTVVMGANSSAVNTVAVRSIDGKPIQAWLRGAHFGEQVINGDVVQGGADITIAQLLTWYHNAQTSPTTDGIPARPVVGGIPQDNTTWGAAITTASQNTANTQAIASTILSTWDMNGFSPMHGLELLVLGMNPTSYELTELVALTPAVFYKSAGWVMTQHSAAAAGSNYANYQQVQPAGLVTWLNTPGI